MVSDTALASLGIGRAAATALLSFAFCVPANAQFWGDSWGWRRQSPQQYSPYSGFWGDRQWGHWGYRQRERSSSSPRARERERPREQPPDYSHAPPAGPRKKDAVTSIVVMGDGNADWLAYGLEDAFSETPDIAVIRKHRTDSGLIRYDQRREAGWPQVAREIIAAEKPKFVVMMIGNNDQQPIRERTASGSSPVATIAKGAPAPGGSVGAARPPAAGDPESRPAISEGAQANASPEEGRRAASRTWEFRSESWELAYIKRIDATIAVLKSAGVPVIWVGLPSQRDKNASAASSYLNELYRGEAEKTGIDFVDIWEGFVDEEGRFSAEGPDYLGQIRRLRTGDGVYFTKFGARKLAHYVEREIERRLSARSTPVALPASTEQAHGASKGKPDGSARPEAGPVVALTGTGGGSEQVLLGGPRDNREPPDLLSEGRSLAVQTGRADDFTWPRGDVTTVGSSLKDR